ncbi:Chromosomal replication initiator protein DnaA [uncultured Desulfobacterium sp.]|uniref:Chromosomal replication initiator protein DnaA n=1 Tax=uncultured Desulfobacterium sp. TaxID=201089 RepID=A0A445MRL8_9BACT|nr:Chromosomal replication initiator protein DnaA [uncultured Desulfobacterium sp.]
MKTAWEDIKAYLRSRLPEKSYSMWINPITYLGQEDLSVVLGCPNRFSCNWVEENYLGMIQEGFKQAAEGKVDLVLKVGPPTKKITTECGPAPVEQLMFPSLPLKNAHRSGLNTDFTFGRFVVGPCNEFAYYTLKAIAQQSTSTSNCTFLCSDTGLGKTHLSHAVGLEIKKQKPSCRVLYVTAEAFANEMVYALKNNKIEEFKNKYRRSCDILLLEEVHFLGGKEKTQAELAYTLDALTNDNKKVVFTSSLTPKDIPNMSKELSSRLTSGVFASIEGTDYHTREKILETKASEHGISLSREIIGFMAGRLTRDVRQMESAVKSLKARAELMNARVDMDLAKEVVACLVSGKRSVTIHDIKDMVAKYYKVDPEMLCSKSRKKIYTYPRNIFSFLCRHHTNEPLERIAQVINRSHSTVVYASELVERNMKSDDRMRREIEFLNQKIDEMKK